MKNRRSKIVIISQKYTEIIHSNLSMIIHAIWINAIAQCAGFFVVSSFHS